ncbi:hypothetical protein Fmac_026549 [Flemingia macrophylla]|uniref:Uncharacterized protein n=1 Tax=Flemingia macrophylla TaxID=520843 RepID=A0ABD1LF65_9FABA
MVDFIDNNEVFVEANDGDNDKLRDNGVEGADYSYYAAEGEDGVLESHGDADADGVVDNLNVYLLGSGVSVVGAQVEYEIKGLDETLPFGVTLWWWRSKTQNMSNIVELCQENPSQRPNAKSLWVWHPRSKTHRPNSGDLYSLVPLRQIWCLSARGST